MDRANILIEWRENEGKWRIKYPQVSAVRLSNLYCVGQRCRDIRGSYRSVLLLIVPRGRGIEFPTPAPTIPDQGVGHDGERKKTERDGSWEWVWGYGIKVGWVRESEREKERGIGWKGKKERESRGKTPERTGNPACAGVFDRPMNWIIASRVEGVHQISVPNRSLYSGSYTSAFRIHPLYI